MTMMSLEVFLLVKCSKINFKFRFSFREGSASKLVILVWITHPSMRYPKENNRYMYTTITHLSKAIDTVIKIDPVIAIVCRG